MEKISEILAISVLPLFLVLVVADIVALNEHFYEKKFQEYNVYATIDAPKEVVDTQADNVLKYVQSKTELEPTLLNEKEQLHLQDVQHLVMRGHQLLILLVFVQLSLWIHIREKKKIVLYGSILTVALLSLLLILPFQEVFFKFHILLFSNDLWVLNPATDNLIKMYPEQLFQDLAQRIMIGALSLSLISGTIGLYKRKRSPG